MPDASRKLKLHPAARTDLERIWQYSAETWSIERADTYLTDIDAAFDMIRSHPLAHPERPEFDPPIRVKTIRSHVILYRVEEQDVIVLRIRHGREDWINDGSR